MKVCIEGDAYCCRNAQLNNPKDLLLAEITIQHKDLAGYLFKLTIN